MRKKTILILGTLDTKEDEVLFLKESIEKRGHNTLIMDAGILKDPHIKVDVSRQEVALAGGMAIDELIRSGDKGKCIENMIKGAVKIVKNLFDERKFDGIISIGGAQAASIGTSAMRDLPFGVPKLMVTTVASGKACFGDFVGTSDVTIMHSVVDMFGVNSLSARVLSNAAGAIAGMVEAIDEIQSVSHDKPKIAMTVLGNTTPAGMRIKELLTERGYEVISFHCNGTGGIAMENLVAEGYFDAVLDLTLHEVIDREYGGMHGAIGSNRLESAGKRGLPQVVVPGCIDYLVFGPLDNIPERFQGRPYVVHNPQLTLVRASKEEMINVARVIADKLNMSKGAVSVVIPMRGLSMHNVRGQIFFDPETDEAFRNALKENLRPIPSRGGFPHISVIEIDAHINATSFAERVVEILLKIKELKNVCKVKR